jgi:hypothetical protein
MNFGALNGVAVLVVALVCLAILLGHVYLLWDDWQHWIVIGPVSNGLDYPGGL